MKIGFFRKSLFDNNFMDEAPDTYEKPTKVSVGKKVPGPINKMNKYYGSNMSMNNRKKTNETLRKLPKYTRR